GVLLGENAFNEKLEDEEEEPDEDTPPPAFNADGSVLRSPLKMPSNIIIKEVEVAGRDEPFTQGKSYIYFMPEGLTQEAAIHLSDNEDLNWTIVVNPVTGQSRVITEDRP